MKSTVPRQCPAVRLDYIAPLRARAEEMSDQEMVDYLTRCLVDPARARPSRETILHAFLAARAVLHTHADAILALTNPRGREATVKACFGDDIVTVPYRRPGFRLSQEVAEAFDAHPHAAGIVLMNHGLITWGTTVREAYERHIELVSRAEEFLEAARVKKVTGTQVASPPSAGLPARDSGDDRERIGVRIRGALGRERSVILEFDDSDDVLRFLEREDAARITQAGAATPDHLLHTKRHPLFLRPSGDVAAAMGSHVERYRAHFDAHAGELTMLDPNPRIVLVPGVGMWTAGKDARAARIVHDIYRHTRSEEHTSELQSPDHLVCRLLLEKKKQPQ